MNLKNVITITDYVFYIYIIALCINLLIFVVLSFIELNKKIKIININQFFELDKQIDDIPVSILVPAYNEEFTILSTLDSLMHLNYKIYEIIVISDGSRDNTVNCVIDKYKLNQIYKPIKESIKTKKILGVYSGKYKDIDITLLNKENGGKSDALNLGINYSKFPIFVAVDADSVLDSNAIKNIVAPFMKNKNVVAVGGSVKISNNLTIKNGLITKVNSPNNILVAFQIIEYLRAFLTNRVALNKFNVNLIISGAFGAFNKKTVIDLGGYKNDTIGEDMELVMRIHKHYLKNKKPYYIEYEVKAVCYTQAPITLNDLRKQRKRWQIGLIHSMNTHKNLFLSRYWMFAKTYFLLFEMITPLIEVFGVFVILISFIFKFINIKFLLSYFILMSGYGVSISIIALIIEQYLFNNINKSLGLKLAFLSLFESIGYRQLISLFRIHAFLAYRKDKHKWGEIKRV